MMPVAEGRGGTCGAVSRPRGGRRHVRHAAPGYAPAGAFPDPVTAPLDLERRRTYEASAAHFETDTFVTVSYLPPPDIYSRLARYFVQGERSGLRSWDEVLRAFLQSAGEFERRLSAVLRIRLPGAPGAPGAPCLDLR
jgi:type IV secretion system protein VirB4